MGVPVLILGESGSGKSASMRNFSPDEVKVINVANKPLPFKNKFESVSTDDYRTIIKEMKMSKKKVLVIDDAQYLMANEFMRRATERGFDKFTEIAQNFWNLVQTVKELPDDVVVYILAHIERDANGNEKIKTIGKLLDEKITVEGMFTIVLKTNVTDGVYTFTTQNNGHDTVKSPIGMFPTFAIDNDLHYVDEKIRNYYELGEFLTDEEIAEIEETVKRDDVPIKEEKKRGRSRGKKKEEESAKAPSEEADAEAEGSGSDAEDGGTDGEGVSSRDSEPPKRTRRRLADDPERKAVNARNAEAVANAGFMSAPEDATDVPFDEKMDEPELEDLPKRKRRTATTTTEETTAADTPAEEDKPKRRRRRA